MHMTTNTPETTEESLIAMHELDDVESLSEEILLAIEEVDDRDLDERRPFCSLLDPDALDALFTSAGGHDTVAAKLSFEYEGVRIDVDTRDDVLVLQVS